MVGLHGVPRGLSVRLVRRGEGCQLGVNVPSQAKRGDINLFAPCLRFSKE